MKVSGHKTRSMLLRYNIVTERETADALLRADGYLALQPTQTENEKGQLRDIRQDGGEKSLTRQAGIGSSGRIRIENQPSTPAEPEQLEPDLKRIYPRSLTDSFDLILTDKRDSRRARATSLSSQCRVSRP